MSNWTELTETFICGWGLHQISATNLMLATVPENGLVENV